MSNILKSKTAIVIVGLVGIALIAMLVGVATVSIAKADTYNFARNLKMGMSGDDVMQLQKLLNSSADTQVSTSGAGSPGNESSYFGAKTKSAVIKWQNKYASDVLAPAGLTSGTGYFGPLSRAKANGMATTGGTTTSTSTSSVPGCTSTTGYSPTTGQKCDSTVSTVPATGGALSVGAAAQPANGLMVEGGARIPFTRVTLTAGANDVTVSSLTVERTGAANDSVFSGVVLLDENGLQLGISKTFNSNHQTTIGESFVVKAGTSRTITVAGNAAGTPGSTTLDGYAGQVAAVQVVAVNTNGTVSGSLPIVGAYHTVNATLSVGSITMASSSYDPNSAVSQPIGTTAYRFSGVRFTAGSAEDITLKSIRWNQTGSVGASDLANVVTYVNGTSYPTTISADGKYFTTLFGASGLVVTKGNSVDVYVQGDIVGSGSAGRVAEFDVYKTTDVYASGNTYGYGLTPTGSFGTQSTAATHGSAADSTATPWFQGSTLSITAGSVTSISKANEVAAQNIAIAVPNQPLGGFVTNFTGEPITITGLYFYIATSSGAYGATAQITSISLYNENGAVVSGPFDSALGDGTAHGNNTTSATKYDTIHFTDSITFPVGRHVYSIKGKIPTAYPSGATITLSTKGSTDWTSPTGQTTGNSISFSGQTSQVSLNQMTVKGASLAVTISTQPAAQNVVAGVQDYLLANYQLDASQSGEDIRLSSFPITIDVVTMATTDITGCALWNGTTQLNTGTRVINTFTDNTAKTVSFDQSLTVPKGTIVTLALKCNVSSTVTSGTFQAKADTTTGDYSVTGVTSGSSLSSAATGLGVTSTNNGGLMTIATGSFTVTVDASSPSYALAAGGSSGVTAGIIKFRATNEAVSLTKLGLTLANGTYGSAARPDGSSSTGPNDIIRAYVYNGSTQVGTATFTGSGTTATSTLDTPVTLAKDQDTKLTIKVDLANVTTGSTGGIGDTIKIDPLNAEGQGAASGSTLKVGATSGVAGIQLFRTYPIVANVSGSGTNPNGANVVLKKFTIKAASNGPVGVYQMKFVIATSSANVTSLKLYAYTDSSYSTGVSGQGSGGQFGATQCSSGCSSNGPTLTFTADLATIAPAPQALQVPADTTYYLALLGTVTPAASATNWSVLATLQGDSAVQINLGSAPINIATSTANVSSANFVWSGNSTTTATTTDVDWTNGYFVSGLPGTGL